MGWQNRKYEAVDVVTNPNDGITSPTRVCASWSEAPGSTTCTFFGCATYSQSQAAAAEYQRLEDAVEAREVVLVAGQAWLAAKNADAVRPWWQRMFGPSQAVQINEAALLAAIASVP